MGSATGRRGGDSVEIGMCEASGPSWFTRLVSGSLGAPRLHQGLPASTEGPWQKRSGEQSAAETEPSGHTQVSS